jgi:hypothetical protein
LYVSKNETKKEICDMLNIGLGSLSRILKENDIRKSKQNFSEFSKRKSSKNKLI